MSKKIVMFYIVMVLLAFPVALYSNSSPVVKVNSGVVKNSDFIMTDVMLEAYTTFNIKNISLFKPGLRVMESDQESNILWATYDKDEAPKLGKDIYASYDDGVTWQLLYKFDKQIQTIKLSPLKVLIVSVSDNYYSSQADSEIYRSEDLGKTFESVLKLQAGGATLWNIDADNEGYMFISEYGYKSLPNNARRIYRSKNNGRDWEIVYQPTEANNYHNHKLLIDKNNLNIIYQSIGDYPNNKLLCSTDRGDTWNMIVNGFNPISAVQFEDKIVWGADTHPSNGIYTLDKYKVIKRKLLMKSPHGGSCYDMIKVGKRTYAGFMSYTWESQAWNGSLWYSDDEGATWKLYAEAKKVDNIGIGFYDFTYLNGFLYVRSSFPMKKLETSRYENYSGTLRIDLRDENLISSDKVINQ